MKRFASLRLPGLVVACAAIVALWLTRDRGRIGDVSFAEVGSPARPVATGVNEGVVEPNASGERSSGAEHWYVEPGAFVDLSGRVYLDGKPAPNTAVVLRDVLTTEGAMPPLEITSDARGAFVAHAPRIRGWYRVSATGEGLAPAWAVVPGDASKDDVELRLETCKLQIYGDVRDASGGEVPGARVSLEDAPSHAAVANDHGRFELCVPPRTVRVRVDADGYGPWTKSVTPRGAQRQDVVLMPEASIVGTTVAAGAGAPIPWALVTVRTSGELVRELQADEHGAFTVARIAPGSYTVEARAPGAKSHHPVDVGVFASARATVTVPLDARVRVAGKVVSASGPVTRTSINVGFSATFEWATAVRTNDAGEFVLDDAPVGNLFVKVDPYEVESPRTVRVGDDGLRDLVVRVIAKAEIEVTVRSDGVPVRDATVYLRGAASSDTRTTSALGVAKFRGLEGGDYRVHAEHEDHFVVQEHVQVAPNGKALPLVLDLAAARQVLGRVVDDHGDPVDGARVSFTLASSTEDGGASATTGADGTFRGGPLRGPATYRAKVTQSGAELDTVNAPELTVPASGPVTPGNLVLVVKGRRQELGGAVVDAAGGAVRDARVIVTRPERHSPTIATTYTGSDGTFALRGLGVGPFAVKAIDASGSEIELKPVSLPSAPLRLVLPPVGAIAGTLKGFTRTPSIMAWSIAGYEWDFHPATMDGARFRIDGLSRGRYHVAASTPDAAAQTTVDVAGDGTLEIELVASEKRTLRGRVLDFVTAAPLADMRCQLAPDLGDTRSPVVVPGLVFTDASGSFTFSDVPRSPLYTWCMGDGAVRGGVARFPPDDETPVTVWGLDLRGKPSLDTGTLGLTLADDHPFSRRVVAVEPRGPAERVGVKPGDVFMTVGDKSVTEVGNGIVRSYLALLLASAGTKAVPIVVDRGGSSVALTFRL